jgi:hypothetical protein
MHKITLVINEELSDKDFKLIEIVMHLLLKGIDTNKAELKIEEENVNKSVN